MSATRDKTPKEQLNELLGLVVAYAKQETIGPLRSLGRFLIWGVIGALLMTAAGILLTLAAIRAVQTEAAPHVSGNLSWLPYIGGIIVAAVFAGLAVRRISKVPK